MTSRTTFAAVTAGCLAAAGLGGFLAARTATPSSEAATTVTAPQAAPLTTDSVSATPAPASPVAARTESARAAASERPTPQPRPAARRAAVPEASAAQVAVDGADRPALTAPTSSAVRLPVNPELAALPGPRIELVEVPANAVIGIRLETTVSSETARVEDPVHGRVSRPVVVDGVAIIPAGALLTGQVTTVERGGRFRERSRIGVRFTSLRVDERTQVPIRTEVIYREGEAPTGEATAKIGASAVVGSILGGVFGGKKGAAIGAATGAAGGTAIVAATGPNEVVLAAGTSFTVRLAEPALVEVGR